MPLTLRLPNDGYMRRYDVENILRQLYQMQCVEIVGMSNVGKSALMRLLAQPDVWVRELGEAAHDFLPVYVDCNRILDLTEQGFCELVLRCLRETNPDLANLPELAAAYETLVAPASDFQVPLSFSRGLTAVLADDQRKVVLLFDEFDDPYRQVDARVFLNLRGIQDRHSAQLAFVTATGRPLTVVNQGGSHGEFAELFSLRTWRLAPSPVPTRSSRCAATCWPTRRPSAPPTSTSSISGQAATRAWWTGSAGCCRRPSNRHPQNKPHRPTGGSSSAIWRRCCVRTSISPANVAKSGTSARPPNRRN